MAQTLYFYDLETTGINTKDSRIMQFAGQRTDMQLKSIGKPHNILIKITEDIIPDPEAVLITGITPQKTISDGITDVEFLKIFRRDISLPGTIFVGYNSVRFDDEFLRHLHYRNFYDAYEWHWLDGRSRWDLLDVVRMMRALRPGKIKWPNDNDGKATNKLELLTKLNDIEHSDAHDALSDVNALIELARLIRTEQPKLFDFMLNNRNKKDVIALVKAGKPFVYTSGKYSNDWEKTTVVASVANYENSGILVFDLRNDPTEYASWSINQLAEAWTRRYNDPGKKLPVKVLKFNHCPAVAPLSVLDDTSQKRLKLDLEQININYNKLQSLDLGTPLLAALDIIIKNSRTANQINDDFDNRLYDEFIGDKDRAICRLIVSAKPDRLDEFTDMIVDERLKGLLPLYKARNFPSTLTTEELKIWEEFRKRRLLGGKGQSRLAKFFDKLGELTQDPKFDKEKLFLLEELQLYGQSIMPGDSED